jgi:hypothetical protein
MSHFDPTYGDLLTAREVSDATNFTLNQLRNWRSESRKDLAPFGCIRMGGTSYYRKVVVQAWIDRNGAQTGVYHQTDLDREFPINQASSSDLNKHQAVALLSKITTENVYNWLDSQLAKQGTTFTNKHWKPTWFAIQHHLDEPESYVTFMNRYDYLDWFKMAVPTARYYVAQQQGLEITLDEILELPVGSIPPINEKK